MHRYCDFMLVSLDQGKEITGVLMRPSFNVQIEFISALLMSGKAWRLSLRSLLMRGVTIGSKQIGGTHYKILECIGVA